MGVTLSDDHRGASPTMPKVSGGKARAARQREAVKRGEAVLDEKADLPRVPTEADPTYQPEEEDSEPEVGSSAGSTSKFDLVRTFTISGI